jgi:Flp pilus assembly protein TadG
MIGIVSYGAWLTAANAVQQAANEAARAALGGLSATERQTLATESVTQSVTGTGVLDPSLVTVSTSQTGSFYSVSVTYDAARSPLFNASPVPLPNGQIRRASVVKLVSL